MRFMVPNFQRSVAKRKIVRNLAFVFTTLGVLFPSTVLAYDNPQIATTSATATVPSTTPTTSDTTAPTNPILIRPTDGTISGDNKPEFVWRQSSDPNGNTVIYTLYLNGVATYLGISNLGNSTGTGYTARLDGIEVKLLPTIALPDGVYTWYVTARDLSNNISHSTTWTFTIDTSPPPLTLVDLDTYHNPLITEGSNFDIAGPKDINFTVLTDPFIEIQITLSPSSEPCTSECSELLHLNSPTNASGLAYLYQHLSPGIYTVTIVAIDRGGNTTVLPEFTLTITQAIVTITIPGLPPIYSIPYTPYSLPSLPATIAKLETRLPLIYLLAILLAIAICILLVFLWRRRYNLILIDPTGQVITDAIIYHSIPTTKSLYTKVLVTSREPISYTLTPSDHGRLYIKHLARYSTFTIRLRDITYILSISAQARVYTIVLG